MEKVSSKTIYSPFSPPGFIGILLFRRFLNLITGIQQFYSIFLSFLFCRFDCDLGTFNPGGKEKAINSEFLSSKQSCCDGKGENTKLIRITDVETVMKSLGISWNPDSEKIDQDGLGSNEVSAIFQDREPSLEEVREAFEVFDENGDGFIDERELQRVLCILGFEEGSQVEECKRMIGIFDENDDGRIDFNEFVKFMECSFS